MNKETLIPVLKHKLPGFVQDDYPKFVQYITDYLTQLEQDNNFLGIINSWKSNLEPENEVEPYINAILDDLGFKAGQNLAINKNLLIYMLKDFYLSRGSISSFKFLFRALFNEDVSIEYPRDQMLVTSFAGYGERYFIYSTSINVQYLDFEGLVERVKKYGGKLTGLTSKTSASIENIQIVHGSGNKYLRIEILRPLKDFLVDEAVSIVAGTFNFAEFVLPILSLSVDENGTGYSKGDILHVTGVNYQGYATVKSTTKGGITDLEIVDGGLGHSVGEQILASTSDYGFGFTGRVSSVDVDGAITGVEILNKGYNYETIPVLSIPGIKAKSDIIGGIQEIEISQPFVDFDSVTISIDSDGSGGIVTPNKTSIFSYKDQSNQKGMLEINSTLLDSDRVQQFSYKIVSPVAESLYKDFVKDYLHPAGYIYSSSFAMTSSVTLNIAAEDTDITINIIEDTP